MKFKFLQAAVTGLALSVSSVASAGVIDIDFLVDGDTYTQPWAISNNSTDGVLLESFVFDLRPLNTYCYDISRNDCNSSYGVNFQSVSGSGATGFLAANVTDEPGGPNNKDFLQINFNDFGQGETFTWDIDVDSTANSTVYGNELIGSTAYAQMSDGNTYFGSLEAIAGNSDASRFVISSVVSTDVPEPTTLAIFALGIMGLGARRIKNK